MQNYFNLSILRTSFHAVKLFIFKSLIFWEKRKNWKEADMSAVKNFWHFWKLFFQKERERERERDRERDRERQTETDRDRDRWRVRAKCKSVISYAYLTYLQSWMSTCQNLGGGAVRDPPKRDNIREPFNNIRLFEWYKPENLS